MDAKKPPKLWRRWGRNEAGKEPFACSHSAGWVVSRIFRTFFEAV